MNKILKHTKLFNLLLTVVISLIFSSFYLTSVSFADSVTCNNGKTATAYCCGGSGESVQTTIDFGCIGKGNPILDMTFAIIHVLSIGVGLVIVASMIYAGILYTSSAGDPQAVGTAKKRIGHNILALVLFIFAYPILNYLVPGAVLK